VPIFISTENGEIKMGDYLTSSSLKGVAMKATEPGRVIGMALESYDGQGTGKIIVFVNPHWYDPKSGELLARVEEIETQLESMHSSTNPILDVLTLDESSNILTVDSHFVPKTNNKYDLGTNANRWKDIYASGTISLGQGDNSGGIKYDTETKELQFTNNGEDWIALGASTRSVLLSAQYPGGVVTEDGNNNNQAEMTMSTTDIDQNSMNYYQWENKVNSLSSKEIKIRYQLPSDFKQWGEGGITFKYATESIDEEENKLDFYVYDQSSDVPEGISTDNISSEEENWESMEMLGIQFNKCSSPGDVCMFVVEMASSKDYYTRVGDIEITYERNL